MGEKFSLFSFEADYDQWDLLAILSDFVLFHTKGNIIEIGIGETSSIFTVLSKKYEREVYHCDVDKGRVENHLQHKKYFDPKRNSIFVGSSDKFFKQVSFSPIALGFIDGGHMYEQAKKDFENLFSCVVDNGYIFIHDTYPPKELQLEERYCGTSYLLRQDLEKDLRVDCFTFTESADNFGLTMVRKRPNDLPYYQKSL